MESNSQSTSPLFPLIRPLSRWALPVLLRSPLSANAVTSLSLATGLAALWCVAQGDRNLDVAGSLLLIVSYVFDNCDGDVARAKKQCSNFGHHYDSFADWIVNGGFFLALAIGVAQSRGETLWLWLGGAAFSGGTINYFLGLYLESRERQRQGPRIELSPEESPRPERVREWMVFAFRELFRADFCFILLGLTLADLTWVLIPAGAIGAQVYWAGLFLPGATKYHV